MHTITGVWITSQCETRKGWWLNHQTGQTPENIRWSKPLVNINKSIPGARRPASWLNWLSQVQWETLSHKPRWKTTKEETQCWPLAHTHTHICAHTHTCIHTTYTHRERPKQGCKTSLIVLTVLFTRTVKLKKQPYTLEILAYYINFNAINIYNTASPTIQLSLQKLTLYTWGQLLCTGQTTYFTITPNMWGCGRNKNEPRRKQSAPSFVKILFLLSTSRWKKSPFYCCAIKFPETKTHMCKDAHLLWMLISRSCGTHVCIPFYCMHIT